jgi:UDP-glucose 4-epimerase
LRVLVTGGAGFIGSHLVDRLLAEGHAVEVVDDLSTGSLANLSAARAEATRTGGELKFHNVDVRAPEVADLVARRPPGVLFHLVVAPPAATFVAGVNVLEAARTFAVGKVIVGFDALALYGEVPTTELPVKEGRPWQPRTAFGVAQRAVADLLAVYRAEHAVEFTGLAFTTVYGPRQRADDGVLAAFVHAEATHQVATIEGDGRQTRDFLYVDDAVDACVRAATRGTGLIVNVGTGTQTAVRDVHRIVTGGGTEAKRAPARPDAVGRFAVSPVRARIHLGWAPWTTLEEGVAQFRRSLATR